MKSLLLIDLSSIAHPIWHVCGASPDVNAASQQIVARVLQLASGAERVAVCCDSGRSFRNELSSAYKANRPERDAALQRQIELAIDALKAEGFPVWKAPSFEADDVIATATRLALEIDGCAVTIATGDKDLCQLVGSRVVVKKVSDGAVLDSDGVFAKFGVKSEQMRDYLTLVGDSSDNVIGAENIGPKKASALLATFGTLDALYVALADGRAVVAAGVKKSLLDFHPQMKLTRELISLRSDAPVPFDELTAERVPVAAQTFANGDDVPEDEFSAPTHASPAPKSEPAHAPAAVDTGMTVRAVDAEVVTGTPAEWERQLDPRSRSEAATLARHMFESRMFSSYGTPQAVLSTIMVGRELGLPSMASLRSIHNIEGKHSLSASLMVALVLKSGLAEYFEPVNFSETEATFTTHRKGARNPVTLTHTFEMGQKAWPKSKPDWEKSFLASGWGKNPTDMLVARAQARLCRMIYPDLLAGLYTPEELAEIRLQEAA